MNTRDRLRQVCEGRFKNQLQRWKKEWKGIKQDLKREFAPVRSSEYVPSGTSARLAAQRRNAELAAALAPNPESSI